VAHREHSSDREEEPGGGTAADRYGRLLAQEDEYDGG
jgi:hypothetical protein